MAQLVITLCDLCTADDDTPPADRAGGLPYVVAIGEGTAPLVVDLCAEHAADVVGPLQSLLEAHGRRLPPPAVTPPAKRSGSGAHVCIVCGHRTGTDAGIVQHAAAVHGLRTAAAMYGEDPATCPLCGTTTGHVIGIAQHASTHGVASGPGSIHRLWSAAVDQGDPVGVVAKRRADLGTLGDWGPPPPSARPVRVVR